MSTEILFKVEMQRVGSVVSAMVLACSSNVRPFPRRDEKPDWALFTFDVSAEAGVEQLREKVHALARSADGGCLRDGSRYFEGPAYYRLWQKRLRRVGVELAGPDLAAVRFDQIALPEKRAPRVSYKGCLGKLIEFPGARLQVQSTGDAIGKLMVLGKDENGRVVVESFSRGGLFLRQIRDKWAAIHRLLRRHEHVAREVRPGVFAGPTLFAVGSSPGQLVSLPAESGQDATIAALQGFVGGDFQLCTGSDGREFYVNEDGIGLGLARNEAATLEARAAGAIMPLDWIKGPCLIVPPVQTGGLAV